MDMGYIVAGANVLAPFITCIFVQRFGQKRFMLFSTGLMAASLLFLTLLAHFQDGRLTEFIGNSPAFGWTVQTAIVAFLVGKGAQFELELASNASNTILWDVGNWLCSLFV